eukprot:3448641-Pleurochrysis_carterae.AAC.2
MHATSAGHHSDTSHIVPGWAGSKAYPPTPSTSLASVVHVKARLVHARKEALRRKRDARVRF